MRVRSVILATLVALACMLVPEVTRAQVELRSDHFLTSDGVELHYLEAGSGPTIVFVPGWTAPAEIWEPQMAHFAATHRVVALDPRSQGRSRKRQKGTTSSVAGRTSASWSSTWARRLPWSWAGRSACLRS